MWRCSKIEKHEVWIRKNCHNYLFSSPALWSKGPSDRGDISLKAFPPKCSSVQQSFPPSVLSPPSNNRIWNGSETHQHHQYWPHGHQPDSNNFPFISDEILVQIYYKSRIWLYGHSTWICSSRCAAFLIRWLARSMNKKYGQEVWARRISKKYDQCKSGCTAAN